MRGCDIVSSTLNNVKLAERGGSTRLLVELAVVVVEESIVFDILAVASVQVQLDQTVEVNLLEQLPGIARLDRSLTSALRLVPVLPASSAATAASTLCSTVVVLLLSRSGTTNALESATTATTLSSATTSTTTSTENGTTTTAESAASSSARVVDDGEAGFLANSFDVESGLETCAGAVWLVCLW